MPISRVRVLSKSQNQYKKTVYNTPVIRKKKQFSMKPIKETRYIYIMIMYLIIIVRIFSFLQCWKDVSNEPVCKQEVQQPVQSHDRRRFPHKRSYGRRPPSHNAGKNIVCS